MNLQRDPVTQSVISAEEQEQDKKTGRRARLNLSGVATQVMCVHSARRSTSF